VKSSALGTILGLVSLVGVGVIYLKVDRLEERLVPTEHGRAAVARIAPDDEVVVVSRSAPAAAMSNREPEAGPASAVREDLGTGSVEERVSRLEALERDRDQGESSIPAPINTAGIMRMPRFARSVDDLSKTLKLNPSQSDRVRESVDRAKRLIEDVMRIPDESGSSPLEQRREKQKKVEEAVKSGNTSGIISFALESRAYRSRTIPGRNTTYGAEIDRIKQESRDEISNVLDPEQQEGFKGLQTDGLYGEGGAMTTSVFVSGDTVIEENR
jgi:Spy/CpxP family protein refolding chaperone